VPERDDAVPYLRARFPRLPRYVVFVQRLNRLTDAGFLIGSDRAIKNGTPGPKLGSSIRFRSRWRNKPTLQSQSGTRIGRPRLLCVRRQSLSAPRCGRNSTNSRFDGAKAGQKTAGQQALDADKGVARAPAPKSFFMGSNNIFIKATPTIFFLFT
jgi:hypothetical protein